MDKKILNLLNKWKANNLITESAYQEIIEFESNSSPTQKSKVAKAITLIGSLFLLSGLLGTLPLIWDNLTYWAQLLLLVVTTVFLIYAANYSEKFEDKNIFIFKSSERVSSVLFLISTISFGSVIVFSLNIINNTTGFLLSEDIQILIVSFMVLIYSLYMYSRTKQIFQHVALFYSSIFFLGSVGNIIFPNIEPWAGGLFLIATGLIWGLYTFNQILGPSWLGYLLATSTISIGSIILIENLFGNNNLLRIILLIIGSVIFVWASIQLSEQVIFYIGGLGLVINLPRLITELLPDNIWPPLILFLVGGVLVAVGLYLNSLRENLKINDK
jgi:MFS family permease